MHHSVWVNPNQRHLLQSRDRIHPRRQMRQEGVNSPALEILHQEGRPVLADGSKVSRKYCGNLCWDCSGPHSLRHQTWWPQVPRVDHVGQAGKVQRPAVSPGP